MKTPALAALLGGFLLAGCAVRPPTGPTILAIPPEGKNLAQFQQEEAGCRNYAFNQIGITPAQGANQAAVGSAVAGTAIGAAAGALLGAAGGAAGAGAAIGAGTGLLAGSAIGANNAQASGYALQGQLRPGLRAVPGEHRQPGADRGRLRRALWLLSGLPVRAALLRPLLRRLLRSGLLGAERRLRARLRHRRLCGRGYRPGYGGGGTTAWAGSTSAPSAASRRPAADPRGRREALEAAPSGAPVSPRPRAARGGCRGR